MKPPESTLEGWRLSNCYRPVLVDGWFAPAYAAAGSSPPACPPLYFYSQGGLMT